MALNIPGPQIIGQRAGKKLIARQDILKFTKFNLRIVTEAGPPIADYEAGDLFYNGGDNKLYLSTDFKISSTPNLAWYKCNAINDNKVQDYGGSTRDDADETNVTTTNDGKYSNALSLNGTDAKLEIPSTIGMEFENNWTFNCWLKLPGDMADGEKVYLLERYIDATHFTLFYIDNHDPGSIEIWWKVNDGTGEVDVRLFNGSVASKGTYSYINFTYDDDNNDMYINGHLVGLEADVVIGFTTEPWVIGHSQKDNSFGTDFIIDEIKFFSTFRKSFGEDQFDLDKTHWVSYPGTAEE